jgi:hypothetical protein
MMILDGVKRLNGHHLKMSILLLLKDERQSTFLQREGKQ